MQGDMPLVITHHSERYKTPLIPLFMYTMSLPPLNYNITVKGGIQCNIILDDKLCTIDYRHIKNTIAWFEQPLVHLGNKDT